MKTARPTKSAAAKATEADTAPRPRTLDERVEKARALSAVMEILTGLPVDVDVDQWDRATMALQAEMAAYPSLPGRTDDELSDFCRKHSIPFYEGRSIRRVLDDLARFERERAGLVRTTRARSKALQDLEAHAKGALLVLEGMPERNERVHLEHALRSVGWVIPVVEPAAAEVRNGLFDDGTARRVDVVANVMRLVAAGATHARDVLKADGTAGGRREVIVEYASFIWSLASVVAPLGIKAGRGGKFEALCTAVFSAAKVRSSPAGAIRYAVERYGQESEAQPPKSTAKKAPRGGAAGGDN